MNRVRSVILEGVAMDDGRLNDLGTAAADVQPCEDPYVAAMLRRYRHRAALSDSLRFLESFDRAPRRASIAPGTDAMPAAAEQSWRFPQQNRLNGPRLDATD